MTCYNEHTVTIHSKYENIMRQDKTHHGVIMTQRRLTNIINDPQLEIHRCPQLDPLDRGCGVSFLGDSGKNIQPQCWLSAFYCNALSCDGARSKRDGALQRERLGVEIRREGVRPFDDSVSCRLTFHGANPMHSTHNGQGARCAPRGSDKGG
jgi:hypothetical protein